MVMAFVLKREAFMQRSLCQKSQLSLELAIVADRPQFRAGLPQRVEDFVDTIGRHSAVVPPIFCSMATARMSLPNSRKELL